MDEHTHQPLVLIADDDDLTRSLMAAALAEHAFETIEVGNGKEAVKLIPRLQPDLVILDVQMPEMDGFTACETIRASEDEPTLPIVIVTGSDDTTSVERAFDAGATDFISKPVNWPLLGHRMRYVLRAARTRAALAHREAENGALLEALPDRLAVVDRNGTIVNYISSNEEEVALYRHGALDNLLGDTGVPLVLGTISQVLTLRASQIVEISGAIGLEAKNELRHYEIRVTPQTTDTALLIVRDVTVQKQTDEQIRQLAFFDTLTKLPNRHHFLQLCHAELDRHTPGHHALFLLDIDHFRRINDTLGNDAGDRVLREVAHRLENVRSKREHDNHKAHCARLGGNEFALLTSIAEQESLRDITNLVGEMFDKPFDGGRHDLIVSGTIGIALFPTDADNSTDLQTAAAHALQTSKQAGGNAHTFFKDCRQNASQNMLELELDLRRALDNEELTLYLQPKYDLAQNTLAGAEALLRWFHPERGNIPPDLFIPMAEESGLIIDIDRWVTDHACALLKGWGEAGLTRVPVSINMSGRAFSFDQPATTVARALTANGILPELLEVEITETVLMADPMAAAATLKELNQMGVGLAIDDFGTGYSSLSYLKRFPLHTLKIDRAFVMDLEQDESDRALCHAMVNMAHSLGLKVVAEGIETEYQRDYLQSIGCELAQGYLLDKPMAPEDFTELLETRAAVPVQTKQQTEDRSLRH